MSTSDERRSDWTFLLPFSKESVVLRCGEASGNEQRILKKRCQQLSVAPLTDVPEEPVFDIIALLDPSGESLNMDIPGISARLKKGGYAYLAIKNRWKIPGARYSLQWTKKKLQDAGFSTIMAYAVLPSPTLPIFFIPVDSGGAISYFFHHLSYLLATAPVETKRRYLLPYFVIRVVIPILPSFLLVPLIRWFSPYYAFVAKKTRDEASEKVDDWHLLCHSERVREPRNPLHLWLKLRLRDSSAHGDALSEPPKAVSRMGRNDTKWTFSEASDLHYLMMGGSIEGGTLTAMVFPDHQKTPSHVLRLLRDETQLPQFLQERDILQYFQTLSPVLRDSVPRLQSCEEISGQWTLKESVMNGTPMTTERHVDLVLPWLIALAKETKKPCFSDLSWESVANKIIAEYQNFFPVSEGEQNFFHQLLNALRTHAPKDPSIFLVHGDFSRHNLFVSDSQEPPSLQVIDWMSARRSLFPFHDLCLFLTSFHLHSRKKPGIQGYLDVFSHNFFTQNEWSFFAKDMVLRYCLALGFDPKLLPFFFDFFLIEQAVLEAKRMKALAERGALKKRGIDPIWTSFFRFFIKHQSAFICQV